MILKAFCTDIDGTLLNKDRELSPKTIATLQRLPKDFPVILASSRMPSAMYHLQKELGVHPSSLICYNGGYVLHYDEGTHTPEVLETVMIPVAICQPILEMTQGTQVHMSLYQEDFWYAPQMDQWTEREEKITKVKAILQHPAQVLEKWNEANSGAHKIMLMGPEEEIHAIEQALNEQFGEEIHIYRSKNTYLELAPKAISKASGLELILQKHGIQLSEVIAFGDNYNDIHMLQEVGLGIAVANARDEVKAVANEVTLKSVEDGVAVAVEKYCF
ncbi:Cof-type HAD-IIB family hydrolase [Nibribacter ruber]|uniref:Cof-type HAD-IIB family hydrolase n=1 Tax=Nibribacter ruber TaxID=2698458 RepID=A0A6P1NWC1_9BACT|nr:Cof-type HAD-IIB family hydrolase [Nibribacter ruber]QHL85921.1 Cof-type HAD-IIB family hydrolase [Nibribacter ruber]